MRLAADFKKLAREALAGKWKIAVLVGLVAVLLGAVGDVGPNVSINYDASGLNASFSIAGKTILSTAESLEPGMAALLVGGLAYVLVAGLVLGIVYMILGGIVSTGYARFNLNLVDRVEAKIDNLFEYFSEWKTMALAEILRSIYIFLWSLLFVIPGIIASYSYAMTPYILAENPGISANEAISKSKEMMDGNKWRLFCLRFSFIGWDILSTFTLGIGNLWLTPYKNAADAVFYREVSCTEIIREEVPSLEIVYEE